MSSIFTANDAARAPNPGSPLPAGCGNSPRSRLEDRTPAAGWKDPTKPLLFITYSAFPKPADRLFFQPAADTMPPSVQLCIVLGAPLRPFRRKARSRLEKLRRIFHISAVGWKFRLRTPLENSRSRMEERPQWAGTGSAAQWKPAPHRVGTIPQRAGKLPAVGWKRLPLKPSDDSHLAIA